MSQDELKLECFKLAKEIYPNQTIDDLIKEAKKINDFIFSVPIS